MCQGNLRPLPSPEWFCRELGVMRGWTGLLPRRKLSGGCPAPAGGGFPTSLHAVRQPAASPPRGLPRAGSWGVAVWLGIWQTWPLLLLSLCPSTYSWKFTWPSQTPPLNIVGLLPLCLSVWSEMMSKSWHDSSLLLNSIQILTYLTWGSTSHPKSGSKSWMDFSLI